MTEESASNTSLNARGRGRRLDINKLSLALVSAGFKSRKHLAFKIQQNEQLKKPPISSVYRAFRGEKTDRISQQRIARALQVEVDSLLEEPVVQTIEDGTDGLELDDKESSAHEKGSLYQRSNRLFYSSLCLIVAIVIATALLIYQGPSELDNTVEINNKIVMVLPFNGEEDLRISDAFRQAVILGDGELTARKEARSGLETPLEIVSEGKADLIFSGKVKRFGELIGIHIFLTDKENSREVYLGFIDKNMPVKQIEVTVYEIYRKILNGKSRIEGLDWSVLVSTLKGFDSLNKDRTSENILLALKFFQTAINRAPLFAGGHIGMCAAIIQDSLLTSDRDRLTEASVYCDRALAIEPNSLLAKAYAATVKIRQGDYTNALLELDAIHQSAPFINTITLAYSSALIEQLRLTNNIELKEQIESLLANAIALDPDNWKLPFTLARYHYLTGHPNEALHYFDLSADIFPSYQAYSNLGAIHFCKSDYVYAKQAYQAALKFAPNHSTLLSSIAALHLHLGEYQQALDIYLPQLAKIEREGGDVLYQIWGNLGDVYFRMDMIENAIQAYNESLNIIEQEITKKNTNNELLAAQILLNLQLDYIQPNHLSEVEKSELRKQAVEIVPKAPTTIFHLANAWYFFDEYDKAAELKNKLFEICPGFSKSYALDKLAENGY